jgi:hypothetical protein
MSGMNMSFGLINADHRKSYSVPHHIGTKFAQICIRIVQRLERNHVHQGSTI